MDAEVKMETKIPVKEQIENAEDLEKHFSQTFSFKRNKRQFVRPADIDNTMPQPQNLHLEWFYKDVVCPSMPGNVRATNEQFNLALKLLAANHVEKIFKLFDNCGNGFLVTEELIIGFRKILKDAPGEDQSISELSAIIFRCSQVNNGIIQLDDFRKIFYLEDFHRCFANIFRSENSILRNEFCEAMERLVCTTNDEKYLMYLVKEIKQKADPNGPFTKDGFKDILGTDKKTGDVIVDRLFMVYGDSSGTKINTKTLIILLTEFILGSDKRKIDFLFKLWDHDDDGYLDFEDMKTTLQYSISESKVSFSTMTKNELVLHFIRAIMQRRRYKKRSNSLLDHPSSIVEEDENTKETTESSIPDEGLDSVTVTPPEYTNPISKLEFTRALMERAHLIRNLTFGGSHLNSVQITNAGFEKRSRSLGTYIRTHIVVICFGIFCFLLNAALAVETAYRYRKSNGWVITARIGGQLLNLNSALIFLGVCRHWITLMRTTPLSRILPFDYHIEIHKWIGVWIFFLSCMHGAAHVVNVCWIKYVEPLEALQNISVVEGLFTTKLGIGFIEHSAFITGWILMVILIVMVVATHPKIRQKGYFEIFFGIHHLFIAYAILVLLHGPRFWKWFIAPGVLYLIERILRLEIVKKQRYGTRSMKLIKAELLPSNVVMLQMARPRDWLYKPGDYIFIKIREISQTEYHPFTISSAPEITGYITLHIQALGNWTRQLQEILKESQIALRRPSQKFLLRGTGKFNKFSMRVRNRSKVSSLKNALSNGVSENPVNDETGETASQIKVFVDGPYGTPSRHIFQAEHAVLVCTGVGVTPFSSILQSIYYQFIQFKHKCPKCNHVYYQDPYRSFKMKKVDFFWVNRNHDNFEWFADVLRDLEKAFEKEEGRNEDPFLDINFFHTGALQSHVVNKVALNLALDFVYETHEMDLLSGLRRARVTPGRPNWAAELERIARQQRGKVTVFYCGNPQMASVLKRECHLRGINFRQEVF